MAVLLRTLGAQFSLDPNARTAEVAQFWTKTLRNRSAWSGLAGLRQDFALLTRTHLQDLFPELSDEARFAHLASAGLVEVQFSGNDIVAGASWDVPWEFLLSAATEKTRARNQPLLVFRHLVTETQGTSPFTQPHNCLVITNNPGFLGDLYTDNTFLREEKNVRTHLDLDTLTTLHNRSRFERIVFCEVQRAGGEGSTGGDESESGGAASLPGLRTSQERRVAGFRRPDFRPVVHSARRWMPGVDRRFPGKESANREGDSRHVR
jgi:hypothetical protein